MENTVEGQRFGKSNNTAVKIPRGARSAIVKDGILSGLTNTDIVVKVETAFPGVNRKNVRTLISRYRQFLNTQN